MMIDDRYPRDLRGYGQHAPDPAWPNEARIAVQFVINYEEGAENCVLHGDAASEAFLSDIVGAEPIAEQRHMNMESLYEYGARAGFWRLQRIFTDDEMPVTVFGVAMALERNPEAVDAMQDAGWEIASHGYRWIDYQHVDEDTERLHLSRAIEIHTRVTGERPVGWYLGRCSPRSPTPCTRTVWPSRWRLTPAGRSGGPSAPSGSTGRSPTSWSTTASGRLS